jgi:hypothetical protein
MSYSDINGIISDDTKNSIKQAIESIKTQLPFAVNLTTKERQTIRKLGPKRLSYATETNRASNTHAASLPVSFKINDYNSKIELYGNLLELQSSINSLQDMVENTIMALGGNIMKSSDSAYAYLKLFSEKGDDPGLNTAVSRISDLLKQAKKEEETEQKVS